MGLITFDFGKAEIQKRELEDIAAKMRQLSGQELPEILQNIQAAWTGENAEAYLGKGVLLQKRMDQTAKKIGDAAAALGLVARSLRRAEEAAKEIALNRGGS